MPEHKVTRLSPANSDRHFAFMEVDETSPWPLSLWVPYSTVQGGLWCISAGIIAGRSPARDALNISSFPPRDQSQQFAADFSQGGAKTAASTSTPGGKGGGWSGGLGGGGAGRACVTANKSSRWLTLFWRWLDIPISRGDHFRGRRRNKRATAPDTTQTTRGSANECRRNENKAFLHRLQTYLYPWGSTQNVHVHVPLLCQPI